MMTICALPGTSSPSFQNELNFSDTSTYGTLVDGTLVKDRSEIIRDGAHVFVGDVELTVSCFLGQQRSLDSTRSDNVLTSSQGTAAKRKYNAGDALQKESKRSKLNPLARKSAARQSSAQISAFLVKKPLVIDDNDDDDDDCAILAEDTPYSQAVDSAKNTSRNMVSFVKESVGLPTDSLGASLRQKPDNISSSNTHIPSKNTARRKKQCIFDVNVRPAMSRSPIVLAEDTQQETVEPSRSKGFSGNVSRAAANVTTCIPDTCDQKAPLGSSQSCNKTSILGSNDTPATVCTSTFAPKISATSTQTTRPSGANGMSSVFRETSKLAKPKKNSIFDSKPVEKQQHPEIVDAFSDDELEDIAVKSDMVNVFPQKL
ncbi:hypothetical protein COOONC_23407 [Cooperia oncophora]